ncbi:hypothetical protein DsansV1_C13g0117571 [Dioscorea sansibarensis]
MRDPEEWKPCKVCGNYPTFREGPICEVCGFPTSGEFHWTQDVSKLPSSEISMSSVLAAKNRSPPSNSLLAKRKIDSQDVNVAPSKKPSNVRENYPTFRQGTTSEECIYPTSADRTQDVSKIISSGINTLCEHDAKVRSPPSNSLLAKRKIDSQDMNGARSKKVKTEYL